MKKLLAILIALMLLCGISFSSGMNNSHGRNLDYEVSVYDATRFPRLIPLEQQVFVEIFSATWCGWCFYAYDIFERLSQEHGLPLHHIRYYNQDSLAMKEAPERTGFYKVSGYPTLIVNGDKKLVGANEQSYPEVAEWVEESLKEIPQAGIYTYGLVKNNQLNMVAYIQSFSEEEVELRFISLLMEDNVKAEKEKIYHYVARSVFPSYDGLVLSLDPYRIYRIEFSFPLANTEKINDYNVVSFIQSFDNKKVYNSSFFELKNLEILSTEPDDFAVDVPRDARIKVYFEEPLLLQSIKNDHLFLIDQYDEVIPCRIEYDRMKRMLIIDPQILLKKNTGYSIVIQGGSNSFTSSTRRIIRDYYCVPFITGKDPEISIEFSALKHDFGALTPIDEPEASILITEKHGHSLRLQAFSNSSWLQTEILPEESKGYLLKLKANPLFMKTGINEALVVVQTILGPVNIPVIAQLQSSEYPAIRIDGAPMITPFDQVRIVGKTNGYRLYMNNREIKISLGGYFNELTEVLHPGTNIIMLKAMNMQRKETQKALIIYRIP